MKSPLDYVVDAIDMETVLAAESEDEGRRIASQILTDMGFKDVDVIFCEHIAHGVRVRARANIHRPGDNYAWIPAQKK